MLVRKKSVRILKARKAEADIAAFAQATRRVR
jgi:hypothetical protein